MVQNATQRQNGEGRDTLSEDLHHELNRRIANILESITDAFFALDQKWRFTYVNRQAERLLQKRREELLGHKIWSVFPGFKDSLLYKKCYQAIEIQLAVEFEEFYPQLNKWFDIHVYPAKDGFSVYLDDITEKKQLEAQREILVGIATHELKNSLAGIKAFAQILTKRVEKKGDVTSTLYLSKIDAQVNKLTKIINDLLDVTKLRTGKIIFYKEVFYFDRLFTEVIDQMQEITETHRITKKGNVRKYIFADRDRISQVLINLISNAIKFSPTADKVVVRAWHDRESVGVSVQDFGVGIHREHRDKIFEVFYRVGVPAIPGLGLGLYIASEIVRYHGGRIWVESKESRGSTFYVTLPIKEKERGEKQ